MDFWHFLAKCQKSAIKKLRGPFLITYSERGENFTLRSAKKMKVHRADYLEISGLCRVVCVHQESCGKLSFLQENGKNPGG
jgi:hypothetical protein